MNNQTIPKPRRRTLRLPEVDERTRQRVRQILWRGRVGPAFWTVTGVLSLVINAVLIAVIIALASHLFTLKKVLSEQLLGGLSENFALMDQASIKTNVTVNTTIPVQFSLPVKTKTTVTLTENTRITNAVVNVQTSSLILPNVPASIVLPAGTELPIALDIRVPVDTTVPVVLNVPVNIPLAETELHKPFQGLQDVVKPYLELLEPIPDSWEELLCGPNGNWLCTPGS